MVGVVPLLIFLHAASINAFLDLELGFFNLFLRSGVVTMPHSRLLKFRFHFQVHPFYRTGEAAGRRTPRHRLGAFSSVGGQG